MRDENTSQRAFLLLDTCGECASVALAQEDGVYLGERSVEPRAASTHFVEAIRWVLATAGRQLADLEGIGVVSGPGSFTGVRVGLALAKGLCEAAQLPMAAVSRLEVLAEGAPPGAACALQAGRDQIYLRMVQEEGIAERLIRDEELEEQCPGALVVVDTPELAARLGRHKAVRQVQLTALQALSPVMRQFEAGGSDVALADANYVRDEGAIYRKAGSARVTAK